MITLSWSESDVDRLPIKYINVTISEGCEIESATLEIVHRISNLFHSPDTFTFLRIDIYRNDADIVIETSALSVIQFPTLMTNNNKYVAIVACVTLKGTVRIYYRVKRV